MKYERDFTPEEDLTRNLYLEMPGAPPPPGPDWSEVIANQHWAFCAAIVRVSIGAAQAYSR